MNHRAKLNSLRITGMMAVLVGIFIGVGFILGGVNGMILAFIFASILNFGSYWFSHKVVVKIYKAKKISKSENPEIHRMVEELSENAGLPKPEIYRSSMKVPNAFATGRSPRKAVVCVTDGLMEQLNDEEIEGVLAHELAHIENKDMLVNSIVATVAGAISMLAEMAFLSAIFAQNEDFSDLAAGMVMMILTPIIATLIRTAISRRMEFRADSEGVRIHGKKEGLKSALQKIASENDRTRLKGNRVQEAGNNLFIYNPFNGHKLNKYFSTHPPLEERINNIDDTVTN